MRLLKALVMTTAIMMMSQAAMAVDSVGAQEPREPEYREPPYASLFPATSTDVSDMDEDLLDIEEFFGGTDDSRSASCTAYCHYHIIAGANDEIHCEVPSWAYTNVVVGMNKYNQAGDEVIMCNYSPSSGWVRIGSCDLDGVVKLLVDGSDHADKIGIIKHLTCEDDDCHWKNDCDFAEFIDDFGIASGGMLRMYGRGQYDEIWGSQFSDSHLEGEYVNGKEGDDWIYLTHDNCTTPIGVGGWGGDHIFGSSHSDDIWADDVGMSVGAGTDYVSADGGDDYIYLGYGDIDVGHGGARSDEIWGGPGYNDRLYGEEGDDFLHGGTGEADRCVGQAGGYDHCDTECEVRIECNAY